MQCDCGAAACGLLSEFAMQGSAFLPSPLAGEGRGRGELWRMARSSVGAGDGMARSSATRR